MGAAEPDAASSGGDLSNNAAPVTSPAAAADCGPTVGRRLDEGERELQRQAVVLGGQGQLQRVSFNLMPQQAGPRIFRVVVTPEEGEFTRADNETLVFTRILQERTRVLLLAGGPGPI